MKLLHILTVTVLLLTLLSGCINKNEASRIVSDNLTNLEPVMKNKGDLIISVDPRIELLVCVQLLSDYSVLSNLNSNYKTDVQSFFDKYRNHSVIENFKSMSQSGFSYDSPIESSLYFNYPLLMKQHTNFTPYLLNIGGGEKKLNAFYNSLQNFAVSCNFEEFYKSHQPLYETMVDNVHKNLGSLDLIKDLEDYYCMKKDHYNVIISPLLHEGGYGPQIEKSDGSLYIYGVVGPNSINKDGIPEYSTAYIQELVWHEFSHPFINPLTKKHIDEINKCSSLFDPISSQMRDNAYTNWEICVNEHIVRAAATRLCYLIKGKESGDKELIDQRNRGFIYIDILCEKLEIFEKNRGKYPSFEDFYPELINAFRELS